MFCRDHMRNTGQLRRYSPIQVPVNQMGVNKIRFCFFDEGIGLPETDGIEVCTNRDDSGSNSSLFQFDAEFICSSSRLNETKELNIQLLPLKSRQQR